MRLYPNWYRGQLEVLVVQAIVGSSPTSRTILALTSGACSMGSKPEISGSAYYPLMFAE